MKIDVFQKILSALPNVDKTTNSDKGILATPAAIATILHGIGCVCCSSSGPQV